MLPQTGHFISAFLSFIFPEFIILYPAAYKFTTRSSGVPMDKRPPKTDELPLDELVSSPQLQTIKLLLPYAPAPGQRLLAAFIKFFELRRAILLFSRPSSYNSSKFFQKAAADPGNFWTA